MLKKVTEGYLNLEPGVETLGLRLAGGAPPSHPPFYPSTRQEHGKMGDFLQEIRQKSVRHPSTTRQEEVRRLVRQKLLEFGRRDGGARLRLVAVVYGWARQARPWATAPHSSTP